MTVPTDFFGYAQCLTDAERAAIARLRLFLDEKVRPHVGGWWERAECPEHLRPELAALRLDDDPALLGDDGRPRPVYAGFRTAELARCDLSVAMLYGGQIGMFGTLVRDGGSPEQVSRLAGGIPTFDYTGCFALTEPGHGSDVARGLETTAIRDGEKWRITGHKRWIGNAAISDVIVVVARDADTGDAKAFLVPRTAPGVRMRDIQGKTSLRIVRNADIELEDVEVSEADRLQRIDSFRDIAEILSSLRPDAAWMAAGMQAGAFEAARDRAVSRAQFGRPIGGFQLVQEKLSRMLGNTTASLGMVLRLTELRAVGQGDDAQSALTKAWVAARLRETVALGREICGGDGITLENPIARFFADAEAAYTYEGTHEINSLIVGRAITGESAFVR